MRSRPLMIVVLAAGKGTRMKSDLPKVLHQVAWRSMLGHVLALAGQLDGASVSVVIGPGMDKVRAEAERLSPGARVFVQQSQLGTADAVLAARPALAGFKGDVMVLYADTPLIEIGTLRKLAAALDGGAGVAVLGFEAADPTGYGRLITDASGNLTAIREDKDASPAERAVKLCNSGVIGFRLDDVVGVLERIGNTNAKGEYYLTDAIEIARGDGARAAVVVCPETEVLGVNSRDQLAAAESIWQGRARLAAMRDGATMIAPETVWLSYDTRIGRDVTIEPNVVLAPGVTVGDGARLGANCYLQGVAVADGAGLAPFTHLSPAGETGGRAMAKGGGGAAVAVTGDGGPFLAEQADKRRNTK